VAVLEGRRDAEVPLQADPDGVAGQGAQQLAALGLGGWRGEVVGELTLAALELVGQAGDELVGVREGVADGGHPESAPTPLVAAYVIGLPRSDPLIRWNSYTTPKDATTARGLSPGP
jgi:hypothetical protein